LIAVHFDNLLFLLLVAVALLFRWLASKAGQTSKGSEESERRSTSTPQTPPPIPHASAEADEERVRKFLEALGQPTTAKPPPPIVPRTDIPPRPVAPIQPPASMRPFSLPQRRLTSEERRKKRVILHTAPLASAHAFEVRETTLSPEPAPPIIGRPAEAYAIATEPASKPEQSKADIAALLRSRSGLRNAIILREIFGPPRSLQPLDLVGQNL